jgi:hypothetical protein
VFSMVRPPAASDMSTVRFRSKCSTTWRRLAVVVAALVVAMAVRSRPRRCAVVVELPIEWEPGMPPAGGVQSGDWPA